MIATRKMEPGQDIDDIDFLATEQWVRNESDLLAIRNGCWFDPERAAWACWWMESFCPLYEGEWAGKMIRFNSVADDPDWDIPDDFEEALPLYLDRMRRHNRLVYEGAFMHWHAEAVFQIYGWVRHHHSRKNEDGTPRVVRRFRDAIIFCAKKNGKSPWQAANGLYLTCGDGESGAGVAFCAKDGTQAKKIVGKHAFKMVQKSDVLSDPAECKTNQNECSITHIPTDSEMFALNSGNERSADAKHGLNLSGVIIDECHVVNRSTAARVGRATRSRVEPLTLKVSTAGDNPDSWGKEQFDLAIKIRDGEKPNDNTYVAIYAAPQNATDDDIKENLEDYIRAANPALGHIVDLQESIADYHSVKDSPYELSLFKYEILNIWQHAAVTWITRVVWKACGGWTFDDEILADLPCVLGYDHAKAKDLSSAVLGWPNDQDSVMIRAFFWCNAKRIRQLATFKPEILEWVDAGFIKVTSGDTHDTGLIKRDLRELIVKNNVIGMVHDPYYCDEIVNFLRDGETDKKGEWVWEPVLSAEQIVRMSQQKATQTGPTTFFEEDVINGKLMHEDNPVLDWQFSHAVIGQDKQGNIVIQKENRESFRTVDGCQASVMTRFGVLDYPDFQTAVLNTYEFFPEGLSF